MTADQQVLDALVGGRALIERPEWWVQGTSTWMSPEAGGPIQRCAGAACGEALGLRGECFGLAKSGTTGPRLRIMGDCLNQLRLALPAPWRKATPDCGIVSYNDDPATTHADVIAVFDVAIGRMRARVALAELRRPLAPTNRRVAWAGVVGESPVPAPPVGTGDNLASRSR